jgi:kynurenine formamidase
MPVRDRPANPDDTEFDGATRSTQPISVDAARLVTEGRAYSLAKVRFPGMPIFPGHPPFQVMTYRSPRGLRVAGDRPWGDVPNDAGLGYMSEVISGTAHSGAHIDALAHMTLGPEGRWYGGATADQDLGDFGPRKGDAAKLPPLFTRGVLLDVATWRGVKCLAKGEPITDRDLDEVVTAQGSDVHPHDVVLIRTGYMSLWPDDDRMAEHRTPGPDISAARWLVERDVVAAGSDTETFEVQPAPDPGHPANPQPVHTHLLIEHGIYLMESLDLEGIAADRVHEFLFVALPLKIRGATGSMVDPLAVI